MCLAIPGKVIKINKKMAEIQYPNQTSKAMLDPNIDIKRGDYVLVQMGVIIKKIPSSEAKESLKAWTDISK